MQPKATLTTVGPALACIFVQAHMQVVAGPTKDGAAFNRILQTKQWLNKNDLSRYNR